MNECSVHSDCSHTECVNHCCIEVDGRGTDECINSDDCVECIDPDDWDPLIQSTVVVYKCGNQTNETDYCSHNNVVTEKLCAGNDAIMENPIYCIDYDYNYCANGTCNNESADECVDSDGGTNIHIRGTTTGKEFGTENEASWVDYCSRAGSDKYRNVRKYFCEDGFVHSTIITCDTFCYHGVCIGNVPPPAVECTDSDGGIDYETAGSVYGEVINPQYRDGHVDTFEDVCHFSTRVGEYYCDSYGRVGYDIEYCECANGACGGVEDPNCRYDSDGKDNWYTKGHIEQLHTDGEYHPRWDYCGYNAPDRVYDYYCTEEGDTGVSNYDCPYGCDDGACLPGLWSECVTLYDKDCNEVCNSLGMECSSVCTTSRGYDNFAVEAWTYTSNGCGGTAIGQETDCTHKDLYTLNQRWKCCCV